MNSNVRTARTGQMIRLVIFTLLCAMSAAPAWGQATAQIHGTVQDTSGSAVPDAVVTATQTNTGVTRTVSSGADGGYVLTALPLGPYTLEVTKAGFSKAVATGIVLAVNSDVAVPFSLTVGAVQQTVSVEANAVQVETRSVGVGTTLIETQRILDLPLNGRQVTDLITLSGLAVQTGSSPTYNMPTGVNISVAGGTSYSIQYNLDGASHLGTYDGTSMPLPFPDALQEFRLVTSTQEASGGGHSGATVSAVTKSGTNTFHGDAFWFFRNAALNGKDYFASTNDQLKRNQFGGVIGGPIKRDKVFFFVGYQGTMTRQTPKSTTEFIPTAAMLTGDFSAAKLNGCPNVPRASALDSNNHLILPLSNAAVQIGNRILSGHNPDVCGAVKTGHPLHQNDLQVPVRVDYLLSAKQSLFARYLVTRVQKANPYTLAPNDLLATKVVGMDDTAQSLAFGHTYLFSSTLINSFRVFGNRLGANHTSNKAFGPADVGITNLYGGYTPDMMTIYVPGAFGMGWNENFAMTQAAVSNFGLNDDVTLVRGAHQITFGGFMMRSILNENSYAWAPGVFIFAPVATGSGLGDFLTGNYVQFRQANPNPNNTTQNFFGLYAGDTWRANSHLTMNFGLRWNPFFPMQFINSDTSSFSLDAFYAGDTSKVVPSAPPGFTYPGDPGFPGRAGINRRLGNFEPRFGFAWDPSGNGKMAIRGGAGWAYDFIRGDLHQNTSSVAPFRLNVQNGFHQGSLDNPWSATPGGNPFPYNFDRNNPVFPTSPLYQGYYPIPQNIRPTQQYSWNLGIQRQVTPSLFASITYLGTHLIHTWTAVDLNPAQYIPGSCVAGQYGLTAPGLCTQASNINQRRLLELNNPSATTNLLGNMTSLDDGGTQGYNGMLLSATFRKQNVNLSGNYTWSHCIGLAQIGVTNLGSTYPHQPYQNNGPVDKYLDYGDCYGGSLDTRHIGNVTMVLNTPNFSGTWARRLGTGWTFSTIVTARSGYPLTAMLSSDVAMNSLYTAAGNYPIPQRANLLSMNTAAPNRGQSCSTTSVCWFNPAAFGTPSPGTYGNLGAATLRGPGFWEWDQTIARRFTIRESQSIEIRAEAFNVTNSVRFYIPALADPATIVGNSLFGQVRAAASTTGSGSASGSGGRIVQLALKYMF